jgi:hypothetical protein
VVILFSASFCGEHRGNALGRAGEQRCGLLDGGEYLMLRPVHHRDDVCGR